MALDDQERTEHDLKAALNALANFIKIAKFGENFLEGEGPEYVANAERAHKIVDQFILNKIKETRRTTS